MKQHKQFWMNLHFWLILINVVSLFFILQLVFEIFPLWVCDFTEEKSNKVNSFIVDLSLGIITSTFFYYLLVYIGERKRSKGIRKMIQWRLNTMAANMQIVIGYYIDRYDIDCEDFKFLTAKPEAFMKVNNLTRDELKYWFRWESSDSAMDVSGSTERGFVCNYIDMVKYHADRIMESTVFSMEETELMELVDRISRCDLVNHISILNHNPNLKIYLGNYGNAMMRFYEYYLRLSHYVKQENLMPMADGCRVGMPFIYK